VIAPKKESPVEPGSRIRISDRSGTKRIANTAEQGAAVDLVAGSEIGANEP